MVVDLSIIAIGSDNLFGLLVIGHWVYFTTFLVSVCDLLARLFLKCSMFILVRYRMSSKSGVIGHQVGNSTILWRNLAARSKQSPIDFSMFQILQFINPEIFLNLLLFLDAHLRLIIHRMLSS